jgi:hypothetical protein
MLTARIDVTRMLIFSERHPRADYAGTATDDEPLAATNLGRPGATNPSPTSSRNGPSAARSCQPHQRLQASR